MTADSQDFRDGMPFLGGALWLDLLNTTPVLGGQPRDLIDDPEKLRLWQGLAGLSDGPPDLDGAVGLRAALRPMVEHLALGKPVPDPVADLVNAHLQQARFVRHLEITGGAARLVERHAPLSLATAAALDFARFAQDHEPDRLKHCQNPDCTMVFYDRGKNNRRRWCSTVACGNRDKVANYRARKAAQGG